MHYVPDYVPEASAMAAAAASTPDRAVETASAGGGVLADPVLWIVVLLAIALGIAQVGLRFEFGVQGGR